MDLAEEYGPLRKGGAAQEVLRTPEFDRVAALPRRRWQDAPDLPALIAALNKYLHINPSACAEPDRCEGCKMRGGLRPAQAAALKNAFEGRYGAYLPLRPGAGKTAVSILVFTLLQSKRPLLIVPADLEEQTRRAVKQIARHWRVMPHIEIVTYQWLQHKNQADFLDEYAPDAIFCDEADYMARTSTVTWTRVKKYIHLHWGEVKLVVASGSFMGRHVREIAHLLNWTLGDGSPMLRDINEQIALGLAIDSKVTQERVHPGALLTLPGAEGPSELAAARRAFRARVCETPGVVSTDEDAPNMPLIVRSIEPEISEQCREAILKLRNTKLTPEGDLLKYNVELWGCASRMGLGFFYFQDPPPPFEWRFAKTEWESWAVKKVGRMQKIDQLSQLADAVKAGEIDDEGRLAKWLAVRDTYDPSKHRKVHWVDDTTSIGWAADWMAKNPKGLIWTPDSAWGHLASERLGVPYFHSKGCTDSGEFVNDYRGNHAIVSIKSNLRGRNFQDRWSANLVMNPPSVGKVWTQLLMRTWRDGQEADAVTCDIILTSRESYSSMIQALRDSTGSDDSEGGAKPLVLAEKHLPTVEELAAREDDLWRELDLGV